MKGAKVVLYHPVTGSIAHVYGVWRDAGPLPSRADLERAAVESARRGGARRAGLAVEKLARLHVDARVMTPTRAYHVDVRHGRLLPAPRRTK
jgi:hypothetical protein